MHPVGFQLLELITSKQDVSPHIRWKVVLMVLSPSKCLQVYCSAEASQSR